MITHEPTKTFFDELISNGYKSFAVLDMEGNRLVSYNNTKTTPADKAKEIIQRFKLLPDGIYQLLAQYSFSRTLKPELYYLKKGNANALHLSEYAAPVPTMRKTKEEKTTDNVLSLDAALSRIEELSKLRAECEVLRQRVKDLEIENAELQSELDEKGEDLGETETPNPVNNWLQTIMPTLAPLADQYFQTKNRALDLEQKKLEALQTGVRKKKIIKAQPMDQTRYPDINNPSELNGYLDYLETITDEQFNREVEQLATEYPDLYEIVVSEFFPDEETEETETEETETEPEN